MVMTIRNTCRMFDNLFQFVRNREMKRLNYRGGGSEVSPGATLRDPPRRPSLVEAF